MCNYLWRNYLPYTPPLKVFFHTSDSSSSHYVWPHDDSPELFIRTIQVDRAWRLSHRNLQGWQNPPVPFQRARTITAHSRDGQNVLNSLRMSFMISAPSSKMIVVFLAWVYVHHSDNCRTASYRARTRNGFP